MREVESSSPVSSNALEKIECAWTRNSLLIVSWKPYTKFEELIPAAMVDYGQNRVQLALWLQQSLNNGFSWCGLSLGHSGQRTSKKWPRGIKKQGA